MAHMAGVPDRRGRHGRRHRLTAILTVSCAAMLAGCRSLLAISEWGRSIRPKLAMRMGFRRRPPCVATYHRVFRGLDVEAFERALATWLDEVLPGGRGLAGLAIDGKSLRGTWGPVIPGVHLLAACDHAFGVCLSQVGVAPGTNEAKAALALIEGLVLKGTVVTGDAMFADREVCEAVLAKGGDYLVTVKGNQPSLKEAIETAFAAPSSPL